MSPSLYSLQFSRNLRNAIFSLIAGLTALSCQQASAQRFLTLEAYVDQRGEITLQQRWMETLKKSGADVVRIKSSSYPPSPNIDEFGKGKDSSIKVIGLIEGRRIKLPNKTFSLNQSAEIASYFKALKDDGAEVALSDKKAFGLTSKQLVDVHTKLSAVISESTRGKKANEIVNRLLAKQTMAVRFDSVANRTLRGTFLIEEELKGLSLGTGLAAILRPLGLVLTAKRKAGAETELHIVAFNETEENWPVGWPNDETGSTVAPKLFSKIDLEIQGIPLKKVLDALENRLDVPFLYDQNGIARKGIDLETKVNYTKKRAIHILAINKMLGQTRPQLKKEIRIDENGKPFLWISPMSSR